MRCICANKLKIYNSFITGIVSDASPLIIYKLINYPRLYYFTLKYISLSNNTYFRGIILSTRKVDLIGQFVSLVLIPRLNRADNLILDQNQPYQAVKAQKSVIHALDRIQSMSDEKKEDKIREWIKRIDAIDYIRGNHRYTKMYADYERARIRNTVAYNLYWELDWQIWDFLHELGYFSGKNSYGPPMKDIDFSDADSI